MRLRFVALALASAALAQQPGPVAQPGAATLLADRGADVNLADASENTPLMIAADGGVYNKSPTDMISLLLRHGAKLDVKDNRGRTALDRATENKNTVAIELKKK